MATATIADGIIESLLDHAARTGMLRGLVDVSVEIDRRRSFACEGNAFVAWTIHAAHGATPAATAAALDLEADTFLGFLPTARRVAIKVYTSARFDPELKEVTKMEDIESRWDRLTALAQIGVQAVGRPVAPPARPTPTT